MSSTRNMLCVCVCCIYSLHKFAANEIKNMKWHVGLKWGRRTTADKDKINRKVMQAEKRGKKKEFGSDSILILSNDIIWNNINKLNMDTRTLHFHYNSNKLKLIRLLIKVNVHWSLFIYNFCWNSAVTSAQFLFLTNFLTAKWTNTLQQIIIIINAMI